MPTNALKVVFRVKETGDGTPWIYFEWLSGERPKGLPKDALIGLNLRPKTSYETAKEIENLLNEHAESFHFQI